MFEGFTRRDFVTNGLKAGAVASLGGFGFLDRLAPVSAADAKVPHEKVRFGSDIEPLVRLIEDTPRSKLFESIAEQMRQGIGYQQLLTGLFLAGVRSIQPRPVGFKFHAVLVVNSAHLASLAMPDRDRWLPLFWALDNFKNSQAQNKNQGDWSMAAVEESKLPSGTQAKARFVEAMDNWDEEGTDQAIVSLVRNAGAEEVIELFWRYGARDLRDIGHKAIYTANGWRTLQTIGWRHAEPVMRSLAYALLEHEGGNPAKGDAEADRPGRENLKRIARIRADWQQGKPDPQAAPELLKAYKNGTASDPCSLVAEMLNKGIHPSSLWDGLFLKAGELIMQQPGIIGIHCVTSVNAMHFGYQNSGNDETRRFLLLQAAAVLAMFHQRMAKGLHEERQIETLETEAVKAKGPEAIGEILADVSNDRLVAARKTLALLDGRAIDPESLMTAARRLIFNKGNDSHDYKFSSAALEDYYHVAPAWRNRYLATSMFNLKGTGHKDTDLMPRARAALEKA